MCRHSTNNHGVKGKAYTAFSRGNGFGSSEGNESLNLILKMQSSKPVRCPSKFAAPCFLVHESQSGNETVCLKLRSLKTLQH